jgi:hypothetical protein
MTRDDGIVAVIGSITAFSSGLLKIVVIENAMNALVVGFCGAIGGLAAKVLFEIVKNKLKSKIKSQEK